MAEESTQTVDLNGEFRFKADAKGRVSLPAGFRKVLSSNLVVSIDPFNESLYVFEENDFNAWVEGLFVDRFGKFDRSNRTHIALRRKLKSRARNVQVDSAGRLMLPADQREAVGIDKNVVIVGNTGYFEVWDAKRYDEMDADIDLGPLFVES